MNKITLSISILILSVFSSQSIADIPNQVLLHYTGTIISKPCDISIGGSTTLNLGDLDIATLSTKGTTSPWLNYSIRFSNCDVSTNIMIGSSLTSNTWGSYDTKTFGAFDSQSKLLKDIGLEVHAAEGVVPDPNMYNHYNMAPYWIIILPTQREQQQGTGYVLPIKFRFKNLTGSVPSSGSITGIYVMDIEYN